MSDLRKAAADVVEAYDQLYAIDLRHSIDALRAALAQGALDRLAETNRALGLDYAEPVACSVEPYSSRMCERGTKGCAVQHGVGAVAYTAPPAPAAPCPHIRSSGQTHWCSLNGPQGVTDAMVEALRDIEMAACYGTEEDPDAGPSMLRTIGEIARKALAEIDSAQVKSKSRTQRAEPVPAQIAVQACRPEDRAMLATPAGTELMSRVARALEAEPAAWRFRVRTWIGGDRYEDRMAVSLERRDGAEPLYPAQPAAPVCGECGGTGELDSGGTYPWGEPAMIRCPCTERPAALAQEAEPVAWIYSLGDARAVSMDYVPGVRAEPLYLAPPTPCPYIRSHGTTHWCSLNGPPQTDSNSPRNDATPSSTT